MEINPKKEKGYGGSTMIDLDIFQFTLHIQLFGYKKEEYTFQILNELFYM
jgi:hypothetical protein